MSFTVVIPARYASTRLPGKPLADICGKPMIQHVFERASASAAERVFIATDDERVLTAAQKFTDNVLMTRSDHESGTDRIEEVARQLQLPPSHIVVNVQGDEPLIPPAVINQVANNLSAHAGAGIATLAEPINEADDVFNPNIVKVVADQSGRALYFSRAPIPWARDHFASNERQLGGRDAYWRHIGIYAYRCEFLHRFVGWPAGQLEQLERLEQLRAMEHGVAIHVAPSACDIPPGIDTPEDLARTIARIEQHG